MIVKPFKDWDSEEIEQLIGIERVWNLPRLQDWINLEGFTYQFQEQIEVLRGKLLKNADAWNEDELKMFFIAPFLYLIDFDNLPHYKAFTQRTLQLKTEEVDTQGNVEFMVATGRKRPQKPFFFLHEYKQEEQRTNDAAGQLLISMVAAQYNNQDEMPLYGCYLLGRFWFFMVLEGKKYSISRAFDATQEDIYEIFEILHKVKRRIEAYFHLV